MILKGGPRVRKRRGLVADAFAGAHQLMAGV